MLQFNPGLTLTGFRTTQSLCRNLKTIDFELLKDEIFLEIDDRIGLMNYI